MDSFYTLATKATCREQRAHIQESAIPSRSGRCVLRLPVGRQSCPHHQCPKQGASQHCVVCPEYGQCAFTVFKKSGQTGGNAGAFLRSQPPFSIQGGLKVKWLPRAHCLPTKNKALEAQSNRKVAATFSFRCSIHIITCTNPQYRLRNL